MARPVFGRFADGVYATIVSTPPGGVGSGDSGDNGDSGFATPYFLLLILVSRFSQSCGTFVGCIRVQLQPGAFLGCGR